MSAQQMYQSVELHYYRTHIHVGGLVTMEYVRVHDKQRLHMCINCMHTACFFQNKPTTRMHTQGQTFKNSNVFNMYMYMHAGHWAKIFVNIGTTQTSKAPERLNILYDSTDAICS